MSTLLSLDNATVNDRNRYVTPKSHYISSARHTRGVPSHPA